MSETSLIIGIDTGGTYTDAVVIDSGQHRILAKAKAITTKGDLAIGVGEALRMAIAGVNGFLPSSVRMVSVSTTLATNAVVEGHGAAAALALIGFDAAMQERSGLGAVCAVSGGAVAGLTAWARSAAHPACLPSTSPPSVVSVRPG